MRYTSVRAGGSRAPTAPGVWKPPGGVRHGAAALCSASTRAGRPLAARSGAGTPAAARGAGVAAPPPCGPAPAPRPPPARAPPPPPGARAWQPPPRAAPQPPGGPPAPRWARPRRAHRRRAAPRPAQALTAGLSRRSARPRRAQRLPPAAAKGRPALCTRPPLQQEGAGRKLARRPPPATLALGGPWSTQRRCGPRPQRRSCVVLARCLAGPPLRWRLHHAPARACCARRAARLLLHQVCLASGRRHGRCGGGAGFDARTGGAQRWRIAWRGRRRRGAGGPRVGSRACSAQRARRHKGLVRRTPRIGRGHRPCRCARRACAQACSRRRVACAQGLAGGPARGRPGQHA